MIDRLENMEHILSEKKGENIVFFDFRDTEYFANGVLICNSLNPRHAQSLIDELKNTLKPQEEFLNTDTKSDEWIIADLGDIIIHITGSEIRKMYTLDDFFTDTLSKMKKNA